MGGREPSERRRARILEQLHQRGSVGVADLAELLGVSPITVRRDLARLASDGELTQVHGGAVAAARRSSAPRWSAGLICPADEYYWGRIVPVLQQSAAAAGGRIVVHLDPVPTAEVVSSLAATHRLDGLFLVPSFVAEQRASVDRWLRQPTVPTVLLEREVGDDMADVQSVCSHHARSAARAVRHLASLGHRSIGVMAPPNGARSDEVIAGVVAAQRALGLDPAPVLPTVDLVDPDRERLAAQVRGVVASGDITAVIVHGDPYAIVLVQLCLEWGVRVPQDLSIVGFGDFMATWSAPPLTAVRPAYEALGRAAVRALVGRLTAGDRHAAQFLRLEGTLVVRDSTAPPGRP